ncbi:MAG: glycosyltransferase [Ignavibacteriaceae bacterium]|nr:glycosyltransferase [Ignavibacteriaceae bacterium]
MNFRVLVIAYYFPPKGLSGVQRTLKFVKYFPHFGWKSTVITSGENAYYAYDHSLLNEIDHENTKILRVEAKEINSLIKSKKQVKMPGEFIRKILSFFSSLFFIPDNKVSWSSKALKAAREEMNTEKYDLIYVSGPPFSSVEIASILKKEFNKPLVIDYRDLWYGNHFAIYPTPIHKILIKNSEYKALKSADLVTVTNRRIKEFLKLNYPFLRFDDVLIVSHGFDSEDIEKAKPEVTANENKKLILTYSGLFYEYITPKYLLKAFSLLKTELPEIAANIELRFVGILRKANTKMIEKLGLKENVKEYGYLEHIEALKVIMESDVLWLMVGHGRNNDTISSGKLFEYFGTGKPVLGCLPDGALKSALEEYGAGYLTKPDDINGIKNALKRIYEDFKSSNLPVPNSEVIGKYDRKSLTGVLTNKFQFLVRDIE